MTQENENSVPSGVATPEKAAPKPKTTAPRKPRTPKASTAKPAAKPASAAKEPPASKKAALPEEAAPSKQDTAETPAEKAAPSKTAGKKPAARKAAARKPGSKPDAPETAAGETAPKDTTAETVVPKDSAWTGAAEKTTAKSKPAPAKTLTTAASEAGPEDEPAAKPKASRGARAAAKKTSAKKLTAAKIDSNVTEPAPSTEPFEKPSEKKTESTETAPEDTPAKEAPEQKSGEPEQPREAKEESPRPSSRRSRRGGRRRNKKNAKQAAEDPSAGKEEKARENTEADAETLAPRDDAAPENKSAEDSVEKKGSSAPKEKHAKAVSEKTEPESAKTSSGKHKMFISVLSGELVEVVLAEEGLIREYYVEMQHQAKVKGNIYKGVVSNIDANLQAAFISYAEGVKNGFLQIDEVHPEYYVAHHAPAKGRKYPPIQKVLKPGQEILVQVVKEPAGTKGAFLTSYLSLPGRFLVLTPGREQIGVSRKVESDAERARLKTILEGLSLGAGLGVIVRTVSTSASKTSLTRDLQFLKRLWKDVRSKGQTQPSPSLIYEELDLSTRAVRDYLTDDVQEVWVDDEETAKQVAELASLLFPKKQNLVQVHRETGNSLFERFSLQKQLDQIHSREVSLPSGGRLVIDNTEALTAIDINSGRSTGKTNFEDMAFRTNLEAAKVIPSQLRLRDIGGQVVVDFIEMRDRDHWREVEKTVRNGMKGDRARYDVGKIGPFGMLEIVRQRLGSSAISVSTEPCPCCKGTGIRRNMEWQAMQSLRDISRALRATAANNQTSLTYSAEAELAFYLLNAKRSILQKMEESSGVSLAIRPAGE